MLRIARWSTIAAAIFKAPAALRAGFELAERNCLLSRERIIAEGAGKQLMADETLRAGYLGM